MYIVFLAALFAILQSPVYAQTPVTPPPLVKQKGCGKCHQFSPTAGQNSAPGLFYAGSKFQEDWLRKFLKNPVVIRKAGYITDPGFLQGEPIIAQPHVALSQEEADIMADYLLSLKMPGQDTRMANEKPLPKVDKVRAKIIFERNYGCTSCHEAINLARKARGGVSGPSLVDAGNRLQADWVFHWLRDPKKFESKGRMPVFDFSQQEEDLLLITKYIQTLKKENLK